MTQRTCSIDGCGLPHRARGWCMKHYKHWRKYGEPETPSFAERFWRRVNRERGPDSCWLWTGATNEDGYGVVRMASPQPGVDGPLKHAHRFAWEFANKREAERDKFICHTCDNRPCCNPRHLYEGTAKQNIRDIYDRHRSWSQTSTHCMNGHEWTAANTILGIFKNRPHIRRCRTCLEAGKVRAADQQRARRYERRARRDRVGEYS